VRELGKEGEGKGISAPSGPTLYSVVRTFYKAVVTKQGSSQKCWSEDRKSEKQSINGWINNFHYA
jgi:hypothetical protein